MRKRHIVCAKCGRRCSSEKTGVCRKCFDPKPRERASNRWRHMVRRCTDPSSPDWKWYGARGIKVCDRWLNSLADYYQDIGDAPPGMTLDRIDNDGNYEPSNVRWATPLQQVHNKRDANLAKTHCPQGHAYAGENLYVTPRGKRICRICRRASALRSRRRRTQGVAA